MLTQTLRSVIDAHLEGLNECSVDVIKLYKSLHGLKIFFMILFY